MVDKAFIIQLINIYYINETLFFISYISMRFSWPWIENYEWGKNKRLVYFFLVDIVMNDIMFIIIYCDLKENRWFTCHENTVGCEI